MVYVPAKYEKKAMPYSTCAVLQKGSLQNIYENLVSRRSVMEMSIHRNWL